jgi:Flp pilus assembly protein TadG
MKKIMNTTMNMTTAGTPTPAATMPENGIELERACRPCRRNRRGAAVVEFALVAPILFLLAFGIIEFGRMVMVQQVLTNASREGARLAVIDGTTTSEVQTAVRDYLDSGSVSSAGINPAVSPSNWDTEDYVGAVTVTVAMPFNQVSWLPSPLFLGGKTLTATAVMRRENTQ